MFKYFMIEVKKEDGSSKYVYVMAKDIVAAATKAAEACERTISDVVYAIVKDDVLVVQ